ncbi:MAG: TIR domain-containing protein [Verrucomicrobia bacterium]|nr:TIR domain-containing protein [Verrucomicrobiota bacterium]
MAEPTKAIFLSYAREDADAARRIADALRSQGLEVWFDENELRGGDAWDAKIRRQIADCTLFVPIISRHTQERGKGYFRLEWKLAVEQTHLMAEGMAFLAPVVVDDTPESGSVVPPEFMRVQWTRLPGALPTPQFVDQLKRLLSPTAKSVPAPAHRESAAPVAPAPRRGIPAAGWVVAGVILLVAGGLYWQRAMRAEPAAVPPAVPAPVTKAAAPAVNDKSIAVLPFTNMSEEKDSSFFTDGIHEDILTNLALVRQLRVVSRTSVMQYRNTTKSIKQIAAELGVNYVLEGSVRRAGNKVRVTGQLIHAATDEHVWAKAYDRDLTDVFAIQAELSQQIAQALQAALSPQETELLERRPTQSLAAYDAYVKARQLRSRINIAEALPLLQTAVTLDPQFAQAWAELGSLHAQMYFADIDRSPARLEQAKAAINRAVELAPDAPETIEKLGDYYYYGYRDYDRAAEQYRRLAVLRPNDPVVQGSMGLIHRRQGLWRESVAELARAVELDPRNLGYTRTLKQLYAGLHRYDEAMAAQQKIVELYPELLDEIGLMMLLHFSATGSLREATEWVGHLHPTPEQAPKVHAWRMALARLSGDLDTAVRLNREQRYFDGYGEPHWSQDATAALILVQHGDTAEGRARAAEAEVGGRAELAQKPSASAWSAMATVYIAQGRYAEAVRCAQSAKDLAPESADAVVGPQYSLGYAQALAWNGDKAGALKELARLLRTPYGENVHEARANPLWRPLRGDPAFEALLADPANNAPLL